MLKGTTTFELTNVKTGEKEIITEQNMFTNALNNIFNEAPYYASTNFACFPLANTAGGAMAPLYNTGLGGLLLFPKAIEENADTFFAPADNKPTGIASRDAYSGEDTRRGSFNSVESGFVTNSAGKEIGYRYVWDFSTSQANGQIACAALTSYRGGMAYLDGTSYIYHTARLGDYLATSGFIIGNTTDQYAYDDDTHPYGYAFNADDNAIYYRRTNNRIYRLAIPKDKILLNVKTRTYESLFTPSAAGYLCGDDTHIWIVRTGGNSSGNATINIDKYSKVDFSKTTETYTVAAPLMLSTGENSCAFMDGYLYLRGYDNASVYKINLSNVADVTRIETGAVGNLFAFGDLIAYNNGIIESDNTVHRFSNNIGFPFKRIGCWLLLGNYQHARPFIVGATVQSNYLATINNLNAPVVKTADKTMKVTYSVMEA